MQVDGGKGQLMDQEVFYPCVLRAMGTGGELRAGKEMLFSRTPGQLQRQDWRHGGWRGLMSRGPRWQKQPGPLSA